MGIKFKIPAIPEDDNNPLVRELINLIEHQIALIEQQSEQIQQLKDEIARLKKQPPKPKIRPSKLEKDKEDKSKPRKGKRPGSKKKSKTAKLEIHHQKAIEPEHIPIGSKFKCYKDFVVQDIKFESYNTLYRLKVYETPDGNYVSGKLPAYLNGTHYGPTLQSFILDQYHHCHVTQPLLLEQLLEIDVDISSGKLNNIITEDKDGFHTEKDNLIKAGLEVSNYVNVDDTGARHQGKNGYCTHIGNELFSWFESTGSKSRINFLKLLRAGHSDYYINMDAIHYMAANKLPKYVLKPICKNSKTIFFNDSQWHNFLSENSIAKKRHIQISTEGALIGSIVEHGISDKLVIVSDDAGQFNVFLHALCWIHAERAINKIIPFTDKASEDLKAVKDQIWQFYKDLKKYKENPNVKDKHRLDALFDEIFTAHTHCATLNEALKRIYRNKPELLLVLERPDIPLHNNSAEQAIRDYVKKRKISGSTRSESGRRCRDTFASLKKTCRKQRISFWDYLMDRIKNVGQIPQLSDLIRQQALKPG